MQSSSELVWRLTEGVAAGQGWLPAWAAAAAVAAVSAVLAPVPRQTHGPASSAAPHDVPDQRKGSGAVLTWDASSL